MNYLDQGGGTRKLWGVNGAREGGRRIGDDKDLGLGAKHQIFPPLPPLNHSFHNPVIKRGKTKGREVSQLAIR